MSVRQFSPLPPNCVVAVVAGGSQISRKRWRNRNLLNIRQRYLQIVAHYDGYDDRFAIPAAIVAGTASATAEIPGNPRNYVDYDGYDAKMGRKARFALEGSKAMNKDMLDRLRSAVCEGRNSRQSRGPTRRLFSGGLTTTSSPRLPASVPIVEAASERAIHSSSCSSTTIAPTCTPHVMRPGGRSGKRRPWRRSTSRRAHDYPRHRSGRAWGRRRPRRRRRARS